MPVTLPLVGQYGQLVVVYSNGVNSCHACLIIIRASSELLLSQIKINAEENFVLRKSSGYTSCITSSIHFTHSIEC